MNDYLVSLYPGAGVELFSMKINARDPEDALVQASMELPCVFIDVDVAADEGIVEEYENDDSYVYLDRTEYGGGCGYLLIANAEVREIKETEE